MQGGRVAGFFQYPAVDFLHLLVDPAGLSQAVQHRRRHGFAPCQRGDPVAAVAPGVQPDAPQERVDQDSFLGRDVYRQPLDGGQVGLAGLDGDRVENGHQQPRPEKGQRHPAGTNQATPGPAQSSRQEAAHEQNQCAGQEPRQRRGGHEQGQFNGLVGDKTHAGQPQHPWIGEGEQQQSPQEHRQPKGGAAQQGQRQSQTGGNQGVLTQGAGQVAPYEIGEERDVHAAGAGQLRREQGAQHGRPPGQGQQQEQDAGGAQPEQAGCRALKDVF